MSMSESRSSESGMTLIEMLITVAILLIIAVPLTSVLAMGLIIPSQEQQRLQDTGNEQLFESFFRTDVQSADAIDTTGCAGAAGTILMAFHWDDVTLVSGSKVTTAKTVDYEQISDHIDRRACDATGPGSSVTVLESLQGTPLFDCAGRRCSASGTELGSRSDASPFNFAVSASRRDS